MPKSIGTKATLDFAQPSKYLIFKEIGQVVYFGRRVKDKKSYCKELLQSLSLFFQNM